ncbi:hypothetical protein [Stenotrophomonas sp. PS02289]|uniref:hypothetical protein n=1 Tax=Stenotrophomonas sp. PS02289 TaxID=2991422 RepID=UPI00249A9972|nr:hypothetical protein [Stenotrophomonas sp. PS02289]
MEDDVNLYRPKSLKKRDAHHDAQLAREVETINRGIRRALGPLPLGGLPKVIKRKPLLANPGSPAEATADPDHASTPSAVVP